MKTIKIQSVIYEMARLVVSKTKYRSPEQLVSELIENEYKKLNL